MDFGAGKFKGARPLTFSLLSPGTAQYRSPQAQRFQWAYRSQRGISYENTEADDVYALGVAAYRMVTGTYPPPGFDLARAVDPTHPPQPPLQPPRKLATVCSELNALILRMLSDAPEPRGSAGELAQALEQAAESAGSKADAPITRRPRRAVSEGRTRPARVVAALGLAAAVGGAVLIFSVEWTQHPREERPPVVQDDGSTAALGDRAPLLHAATQPASSKALGLEMPKRPFKGQRLPPCQKDFEVWR
jgi:hypothetical protein